jgi:hypothetical protein
MLLGAMGRISPLIHGAGITQTFHSKFHLLNNRMIRRFHRANQNLRRLPPLTHPFRCRRVTAQAALAEAVVVDIGVRVTRKFANRSTRVQRGSTAPSSVFKSSVPTALLLHAHGGKGVNQSAVCQPRAVALTPSRQRNGYLMSVARPVRLLNDSAWMFMKLQRISSLLTLIPLLLCSCTEQTPPPKTSRFHVGEVWSFHTAADEPPGATLTIVQVDIDPEVGPIIYTSISGVRRRKSQAQMFFPFSEDALARSVIARAGSVAELDQKASADFQWFYQAHLQSVARGEAGKCFSQTAAEVLAADQNSRKTH